MAKTQQTAEKSTRLPKKEAVQRGKNGGARPGAGRKPFEPTDAERKQVEAMSGYGVPFEQIAALIRDGIHVDTLREKFPAELVNGKAKANAQVGKGVFQKAMAGDTTAMIWWTKCQMGWKEPPRQLEHSGKDGAPIVVATIDVSGVSTSALAEIMAAADAVDPS